MLESYSILWWLACIVVAYSLPRFGGLVGLLGAPIAITALVVISDLLWIQSEMHRPGWDGQPDQDFVFVIGTLLRIVFVNSVLLPIGLVGFWKWAVVRERERHLARLEPRERQPARPATLRD